MCDNSAPAFPTVTPVFGQLYYDRRLRDEEDTPLKMDPPQPRIATQFGQRPFHGGIAHGLSSAYNNSRFTG